MFPVLKFTAGANFSPLQVREEVRGDSRAGLGSSKNFSRSLDTAGGVASTAKRSVRNRYEEVTQRNEAKRRRLELNDL